MKNHTSLSRICLFGLFLLFTAANGFAQLRGDHILGDFGLNAGTQAPPSIVLAVPFYIYNASDFKDSSGDKINTAPNVHAFITGLGGNIVTNVKVLNANWGARILIGFVKGRVEIDSLKSTSNLAFGDMYVQPVNLSWKGKKADFIAGYAMYIPTGRYETGATDNSGLGMWGHEFSAGSTYYFNKQKSFSLSTILFYELHSKKKNSDMKTGDIFTMEGGLNKRFLVDIKGSSIPMVINTGAIYYMQFKMTDDKFPDAPIPFNPTKDHIYGLGVEGNFLYPKTNTSLGIRWLGELGAKSRSQGNTFFITVSQLITPLEKKK